ncbi:pseudaminic acid cytidylyltransferase [Eubacterium sp. MSJ-33]|uniref:pseudaminic acid cytidylyltransferase n=1 Tax=Eubacterium sp. MSJ-33 TaxID=2841528 RepID=UPI001C0FAF9F|nr:pseudaminic acid cytidylyltransferase [Eubacterium sp. MSJ-33]MBU5476986.1 pseudaminic acid cytidylyltransferase [Eubacterium sp. MSJ-21]QWT52156.1 pseudaminic acid cytidylyltransferase [Eubacterium sp. MSJ-33]
MKNTVAVITARGGSKRIPKKNIKEFCGKPIIAYAIQAAIASNIFDEVMVSTDSEEIAKIARDYGAVVPFMRSEKNADDYATTEDVIMEVVNQYKERGKAYAYVCCLYPTTPFITSSILKEAVKIMVQENPAVVIPVVQFSYPPQRCFVIDENGYARFKYPEYVKTRSQDLEKQYHDAGQFYIYHVEKLFAHNGIIEDDFKPIILPEMCVQDIDTLDDWKMAEMKYRLVHSEV